MIALSLDELVEASENIVSARAVNAVSHLESSGLHDEDKLVVTDVTLEILDVMKGPHALGQQFTFRYLGGQLASAGFGMRVEGAARIPLEGQAIFFMQSRRGVLRSVGMSQGVWPVHVEDGRAIVEPGGVGLSMMQTDAAGHLHTAPAALAGPRPLDEVVADIRARVRRGAASAP